MIKKLRDATVDEARRFCEARKCVNCPFGAWYTHCDLYVMPHALFERELNTEIDIPEENPQGNDAL